MESKGCPKRLWRVGTSVAVTWTFQKGLYYNFGNISPEDPNRRCSLNAIRAFYFGWFDVESYV